MSEQTLSTGHRTMSSAEWARMQAELFEASNGQEANTANGGLPIILLTSVGARSGQLRKNPLMRVEHDGEYLVVGSKEGAESDPAWVHNVRAHPRVQLQDGADKHYYFARELEGQERELWWARAVEAYSSYADYQGKTTRLIPVFLLTRTNGG